MNPIPTICAPAYSRESIETLNHPPRQAITADSAMTLNNRSQQTPQNPTPQQSAMNRTSPPPQQSAMNRTSPPPQQSTVNRQSPPPQQNAPALSGSAAMPPLLHELRRGQKVPLDEGAAKVRACFGWTLLNPACELDASVFLIGENGKVRDDGWFVFYGQPRSPDGSVILSQTPAPPDRETITIDLRSIHPSVAKIVFVFTIHEAFERSLNFSMVNDTYIRLLNDATGQEMMSYRVEENHPNVTSMTVAELYRHQGKWKLNPVGNGIHDDLSGQCAVYGVQVE